MLTLAGHKNHKVSAAGQTRPSATRAADGCLLRLALNAWITLKVHERANPRHEYLRIVLLVHV